MHYIQCNHCGKLVEIKSQYMVFCPACKRKMDNSFTEWRKRNPGGSYTAYLDEMAVSESALQGVRDQRRIGRAIMRGKAARRGLLALGIALVVTILGISGYWAWNRYNRSGSINALLNKAWQISYYDDLGTSLSAIGVKYDDETRTVINPIEDPEFQENIKMVHQMYADGIINGDAPTTDDSNGYRTLMVAQGWSGAAKTNWGPNNGIENCEAIQIGPSVVSNMTVRGSLNGISNSCKNPEKALEFLQLINTDSYVRDLFYYGVQGDNWEYDDNGKVHKLKEDAWAMAGYTQATFFNVTQLDSAEFNEWEEVKELNENATPSVMLGFNMDTSEIETELANCRTVWEKYKSELLTGARDPEELIPTMVSELEAAGWQTIADAAQAQIDAYYGQ